MKFKKKFNETYEFYRVNAEAETFDFCGAPKLKLFKSYQGKSAKECFYIYDSTGKLEACCEPTLLLEILFFKQCLNFFIKESVEGFYCTMEPIEYYLTKLIAPPPWVRKSFANQLIRHTDKIIHTLDEEFHRHIIVYVASLKNK